MNKIKSLLILACLLSLPAFAATTHPTAPAETTDSINKGINFQDISFSQALKKAEAEGKKVFIDCYIKSCVPCKYMMRYIFPMEECGAYFNPRFVSLSMDMDEGDGPEVRKKYDVGIYPTFLIINPDGSLFVKDIGAVTLKSDITFVDKISNAIQRAEMTKKYVAGERGDSFVRQYINILSATSDTSLSRVVNNFLATKSVKETCQPENWKLVETYVNSPSTPVFRRLLANRDSFETCLGKDVVMKKIIATYQQEFDVMKMLDLDYPSRIADLNNLQKHGYPVQCLTDCMTLRMIINNKLTDKVADIVNILNNLGSLPENERMAVVKELRSFERIATDKQRREAADALRKLKQGLSATNASAVDRYISRITPRR